MDQVSFLDAEYNHKKKKTRREIFLESMEQVVPWKRLEKRFRKYYSSPSTGRPPCPLSSMLRIHCMQHWYNMSDPVMEDALYEIRSMRKFAGLSLERLPDETTIFNFRHLLEQTKASIRSKVEYPFRIIKRQFGFTKARYRGMKKNDNHLKTKFALANLYMCRQKLVT